MDPWSRISQSIEPLLQSLLAHPVYEQVGNLHGIQVFMQHHVFAVWDFMSLLKALQRQVCCVAIPWLPPPNAHAARLINEIVLGEETDATPEGGYASHYDLYHRAMQTCGADTAPVDRFLAALRSGHTVAAALQQAQTPAAVQAFVRQTFELIESGNLPAIAAAFTFGREDLLPGLFERLVAHVNTVSAGSLEPFLYYLDRHVSLDQDEHGPLARQLVATICGDDPARWQAAEDAAQAALRARLDLWNALGEALPSPAER
jgi:hypothetical protein